jgi:hypothetical protein
MKSSLTLCLIAGLNMPCFTAAFSSIQTPATFQSRQATILHYTVIGGIDEEEEQDAADPSEAEPNFWAQRKADNNGGPGDLSGYSESSDELVSEIDTHLNVDAYSNGPAGGIMGGFQLTGLCGDD